MRNAVARFDDAAFDEPARKTPRKPRAPDARKKPGAKLRRGKRRYLHYAAIGLSASLAVGIMVNALLLQHSHHPAPLFGKAIQLGALPPMPTTPSAVQPKAPDLVTAVVDAPTPAGSPLPAALPAPTQRPHRVAAEPVAGPPKAKQDDAIAKLLKTSASGGAAEKTQDKAHDKENGARTVLATQHALMKLGFVVKPNGVFTPATKSAIEAFERDQNLPVKGEMNRKVLKQLSAESGVAID